MDFPTRATDSVATRLARDADLVTSALRQANLAAAALRQTGLASAVLQHESIARSATKLLNPLFETMSTVQQASTVWSGQWMKALEPTLRLSELMARSHRGLLANLQREVGLASQVIREGITNAMRPILEEQRRWQSIQPDLGLWRVSESLRTTSRQWDDLAALAGVELHAHRASLQSLVALQHSLAASGTSQDWFNAPLDDEAERPPSPISLDDIKAAINEALDVQIPIHLASLHQTPRQRIRVKDLVNLFLALMTIVSGLASIDGWRLARQGAQENPTHQLPPDDINKLRESMLAVLALGRIASAPERLVSREARLYKSPNRGRLKQSIPPGALVRVLEERHEWIAVSFEDDDAWVSGWVLKKYTERIPSTSSAITK